MSIFFLSMKFINIVMQESWNIQTFSQNNFAVILEC